MTEIIKSQLATIPKTSGIYKFLDAKDRVLYVGKAKNLAKRVASYTKMNQLSTRIARMVSLAKKLEFIQTENEVEALLLEHNLIKDLGPRFNILLRDDKTFPQILISDHKFPQISKYRGTKTKGSHFGPFASAHDVNRTIDILRKIFLLRTCSDSEFKSRKKPCLEYQIKRCSAPCVDMITKDEYHIAINHAINFLSGKSAEIQKQLKGKMEKLSQEQNYEQAAFIRDQIKSLNTIQTKQNININQIDNADIITIVTSGNMACIYISFFRSSRNLGAKPYFYEIEDVKNPAELLAEFLGQFYLAHIPPSLILTNQNLEEKKLIAAFLEKLSNKKTSLTTPQRGIKLNLIKDQEELARQNLENKIAQKCNNKELLAEVTKLFNLKKPPQKIEVYDNSHTGGSNAIGALIAAGREGFIKSGYRKFNIKFEEQNGKIKRDDTAMMREVFTRRFSKLNKKEYPDLIIIDGGRGQLNSVYEVLSNLKVDIPLVAMSKGENRNAGEEFFHQINKDSFTLTKNHPTMYYLQRLRDEAHRFAIMTHRSKRKRNFIT